MSRADSSPSSYVSHKIGLKDVWGKINYTDCMRLRVPKGTENKDQWTIISKSTLMQKEAELLPSGVLTVYCDLKVSELKHNIVDEVIIDGEEEKRKAQVLFQSLENLFDTYRMNDPAIRIGETNLPAHEIIRANIFKLFDGMYENYGQDDPAVDLSDLRLSTVRSLLRYIYFDWGDDLPMDALIELYAVAKKFQMTHLLECCRREIIVDITYHQRERLCDVALLANKHGDEELAREVRDIFRRNREVVVNGDKWKSLLKENPALCIKIMGDGVAGTSRDEDASGNLEPKRVKYF